VLWRSEPVARRTPCPVSFGPTLVLHEDIVLFAGGTRSMTALAAADGRTLWTAAHHRGGHMSPEDLLVVGGLAWSGQIAGGGDSGVFTGRDLRTGEVKSEFRPDVQTYWFHHRCYRSKATDRFILSSRTGIEFIDFAQKHWMPHHWVRGGCIYGIMPCNGLVYAPPHSCGCYLEAKLNGFNALAPAPAAAPPKASDADRLERGPAYGRAPEQPEPRPDEWPTYRHDPARSGSSPAAVPTDLRLAWQAPVGGRLSSIVVAGGRLYVASIDAHTVHAFDAASGKPLWSFTTGGRVDSPPTVHEGSVLFGSADGWVYCLRAEDGALAWRFRAAPEARRVTAFEQVESAWPVHGSVLVQDGVASCVAGRSMFLDGGLHLVRLDAKTGRKLSETVLDDRDPATGRNLQVHVKGLTMPVALPDVLSSDGRSLYMRSQRFDLEGKREQVAPLSVTDQVGEGAHLFCEIGFLDDSWFHRSYWLFGRAVAGGYGGWYQAARLVPAGRLLVFDDSRVYGYGRKPEYICNASVLEYQLYAADKQASDEAIRQVRRATGRINARSRRRNGDSSDWKLRRAFPARDLSAVQLQWATDQPSVQVRAMALAGQTLFVAGPPDLVDERRSFRLPDDKDIQAKLAEQRDALEGRMGSRLWAVAAADGKPAARYRLDALPVFDGLVAARGRLFLATTDGRVLCLAGNQGEPLPRADAEPLQVIADEPPEPNYVEPPEVRKDKEFDRVVACAVLASKFGYRLRARERNRFGFAVKALQAPLEHKATLEARLQSVPQSRSGGFLVNGFIAFGDGSQDAQLVKCGVRIYAKKALAVQGTLEDGKTASQDLAVDLGETLDVSVAIDLDAQKLTLTVKGVVVEAPLARPLKAITHVGYAVDGAYTDFTPVKVSGK
jgi:outer membrane protein assembly factor BamB